LDYLQAIFLALLQGITEFLPVSSSAHLILVPELLGWQDQGLAFDVAVHVGTLIAVMAFLKNELAAIIPAWFAGWPAFNWDNNGKLGWLVVLATIPVGLVGLLAGDFIESNLRSAMIIAGATLVFGLLLGWYDRAGDQNSKAMESLTWSQTLVVGVAQAFALIPGTSRSGVTMTALLALGYSRIAAAKFSFLLAVPTIALGGMFAGKDLLESNSPIEWWPILIGVIVSAVFALLCIRWFMRLLQTLGMKPFVYYRVFLAIMIVLIFYI